MASNSDSSRNFRGRRFRNTARELIKRWRYRGHTGRLIRRHRALRTLDVQTSSIAHPLFVTIGFFAAIIAARNLIGHFWTAIIEFWCQSIALDVVVRARPTQFYGAFSYDIPQLRLEDTLPTGSTLLWSLAIVLFAMAGVYLFFRRFLPFCYFVWAVAIIQLSSIFFFYTSPGEFPYSAATHVSSSLEMTLMLLAGIPFMLMVAYYPLNFSLGRKIALTGLMMVMVMLFAPHLYTCHLVLMNEFSVLYMPVLFTVFGLLPIVVMIIAIYGWGMSWQQRGAA